MKDLKKILIRVFLLLVLLIAMNFIYKQFLYEKDLQKHSEVINLVRAVPESAKIVYVGESSNVTYRENDFDKRPISDFISDYFPDLEVYHITKPASHAGIYKVLLSQIPEESEVETVIVTLNMRSFNATWIYSNLETPLQKSMVLLKDYPPLFNRFLLSFKAYDIKNKQEREKQFKQQWREDVFNFPYEFPHENVIEWDKWMATTGIKDSMGNLDNEKTILACHFIKTYAFQIDTTTNPRIKDFLNIIELAEKRGWNLIFNLMAENTEKAKQLVGNDLIYLMEQNRDILTSFFSNKGVVVVDNLDVVPDEEFIDQDWTTEHYAETGRKIVAGNVAERLKGFYPDKYENLNNPYLLATHFFNNCETNSNWGQVQTITDEVSYSGDFSSKTGSGNDYSITLEYPFDKLPDSLKNEISVKIKLFQTSTKHESKFVIQAFGNKSGNYWNGIPVSNELQRTNDWGTFTYTFIVPENLQAADLIKLYVYNPSSTPVFVDDFEVWFR